MLALRAGLPLLFASACAFQTGKEAAHDHGELFWTGKVNVDPFHLGVAGPHVLRPAFEFEVSGVRGVPRPNDQVHAYDVRLGTLSFAPEIRLQDWLSVTPQVGFGKHDFEATLEIQHAFGRQPVERVDDGYGALGALQVTLEPWSWLRFFGRIGSYAGGNFDQDFSEAGVKVGVPDSVWIFAAWRRAEMHFSRVPENLNSVFSFDGDLQTSGLLVGAEVRF